MTHAPRLLPALSLILTLPALAALADAPERVGSAPRVPIAVLSGDWNGDEIPDAVFLVQGDDGTADIHVLRGAFRGLEADFTVPGAVFAGPMGGQTPGLVALTPTSFAIASEQIGIGRTPWMQRITVAYRDGGFVVAGFTHDFYDRLDLGHYGRCDVNLLTGAYEITRGPSDGTHMTQNDAEPPEQPDVVQAGHTAGQTLALQDLRIDFYPSICNGLYGG